MCLTWPKGLSEGIVVHMKRVFAVDREDLKDTVNVWAQENNSCINSIPGEFKEPAFDVNASRVVSTCRFEENIIEALV